VQATFRCYYALRHPPQILTSNGTYDLELLRDDFLPSSESAVAPEPGEGAFDHPAPGLRVESPDALGSRDVLGEAGAALLALKPVAVRTKEN
jgi:hypothetical protein